VVSFTPRTIYPRGKSPRQGEITNKTQRDGRQERQGEKEKEETGKRDRRNKHKSERERERKKGNINTRENQR
jgi:hypothetical protein